MVEYPWVVSRLTDDAALLLDAGSALNHSYVLDLPILQNKTLVIYTLAPEWFSERPNVSHIFGDLRKTILNDSVFDEIVSISTLEHIGMDNTKIYTSDQRFHEHRCSDYRQVMREFHRLLAPGGRLLLTVPFGNFRDFGWLQQFDRELLEDAILAFKGTFVELTIFRYTTAGWVLSSVDDCRDCEYRDPHDPTDDPPDGAAAARAVACVQLER